MILILLVHIYELDRLRIERPEPEVSVQKPLMILQVDDNSLS